MEFMLIHYNISWSNFSTDTSAAGGNINECGSSPCKKGKKTTIIIPIVASVGGLVFLLLAAVAILLGLKRGNNQGNCPHFKTYIYNSELKLVTWNNYLIPLLHLQCH